MMDYMPTIETNNSWSTSVQLRDSVTRQRSCSLYTTTDSLYSGVTSLLYLQALQCRGSAHPEGTKRAIFIAKQWRVWQLFPLRRQRERETDRQTDRQIYNIYYRRISTSEGPRVHAVMCKDPKFAPLRPPTC